MTNTNANLDQQNAEHRMAAVLPEEAVDHYPDPFHDAEAYEGGGWGGDGSGVDDFADYNANEVDDYANEGEDYANEGEDYANEGEDEGCWDSGGEDAGWDG